MKKNVMIVDSDVSYRDALHVELTNSGYNIISSVDSVEEAIGILDSEEAIDLVILDIVFKGANGFELLTYIAELNDNNDNKVVPIVVSNDVSYRRDAFRHRSRQFIQKDFSGGIAAFIKRKMLPMIEIIGIQKQINQSLAITVSNTKVTQRNVKAIAIGVSTGGPKAVMTIMPKLRVHFPNTPIFIVQHMPENFTLRFAENLSKKCGIRAMEVCAETIVQPGMVYIAKGGIHMVLKGGINNVLCLEDSKPVNNCKPSVDVFLNTFADVYGKNGVTIILTGMGNDGSKSLEKIKHHGGTIFVQDEDTSVVWGMPGSAVKTGFVDKIVPLEMIPDEIRKLNLG